MRIRGSIFAMSTCAMLACTGPASDEASDQAMVPTPGGPATADPAALVLADSVVQASGGWEAWNEARYLEFTFVVSVEGSERRRTAHRWDRTTGDCRVEGQSGDGKPFLSIWNLHSGDGRAWLDGLELAGDEAHEQLEHAAALAVNDGYWLLMPLKLHDPGVHLEDEGVRADTLGKAWRVLALHFDAGVGLTPGDRYWVYVDPATGTVGRWDYVLESFEPGTPPSEFSWDDWRQVGPLRLSMRKLSADGRVEIRYEGVTALPSPSPGAFAVEAGT